MQEFDYKHFDSFCNKVIQPIKGKLKSQRAKARKKSLRILFFYLLTFAVLGYLNYSHQFFVGFGGWFTFFIVSFSLLWLPFIPLMISNASIRYTVLPKIMNYFPGLKFNDIRYGVQSQLPRELMNEFSFPERFITNSNKFHIEGILKDKKIDIFLVDLFSERKSNSPDQKALFIKTNTSKKFSGKAVLASEWLLKESNYGLESYKELKLSDGYSYTIKTNDHPTASECFDSNFIQNLNSFVEKLSDYKSKVRAIQCGYYKNQMFLHFPLRKEVLDIKFTSPDYLEASGLKHILYEMVYILKLASEA